MTTPQRAQDSRWLVVLLAALTFVLALLLPATPASATPSPAAETRVGASTVATAVVVGVHECITAGQRPVRGPSQPQIALGNCVAAEDAGDLVASARAGGGIGAGRNVAGLTLEAGELRLSEIAVSGVASRPGMVPNVGLEANLQRFIPTASGGNSRFFDSEFKLLNFAANQLGPSSNVSGVLRLHSELPVCPSCISVISQFRSAYPNIRLNVTTG